jgi:EmrB/QacA subfamily drug resistance transporter
MERSRWLALTVLCAAMMMIILDGTIVTVALPTIQRDLGFSSSGLAWVVNAYLIAFGGLLLLAGRLGDLIGGKRIFLAGLIVFTAASLLCGFAVSPPMLIAARFVQGIGGALASAVSLGMIVRLFPEPPEQAKAMGAYSFVGAGGASVGLVLGGVLTQALSWHWIFFVNVPIGVAAIAAGGRLLRDERGMGLAAGADAIGAVLVTAGLMIGVYAIVETTRYGWGSMRTLGTAAAATVLLAAFFVRQHIARTPLLPLRIFRSRSISGANAVQALTVAAAFGFQVLIPQYLQRVLGYGAAAAGVGMLPAAVVIGAFSVGLSARLIARFGLRVMLVAGLAPIVAGFALLTRLPVAGFAGLYPLHLLPTMLLIGGFGLAFPAMITLAMSGVPDADAGVASGLVNTTQQVGAALGVAVLSTLAAARTGRLLAAGRPPAAALTGGYHVAFGVSAGLAAVALVLAAAVLRPAATARRGRARAPIDAAPGPDHHEDNGAVRRRARRPLPNEATPGAKGGILPDHLPGGEPSSGWLSSRSVGAAIETEAVHHAARQGSQATRPGPHGPDG